MLCELSIICIPLHAVCMVYVLCAVHGKPLRLQFCVLIERKHRVAYQHNWYILTYIHIDMMNVNWWCTCPHNWDVEAAEHAYTRWLLNSCECCYAWCIVFQYIKHSRGNVLHTHWNIREQRGINIMRCINMNMCKLTSWCYKMPRWDASNTLQTGNGADAIPKRTNFVWFHIEQTHSIMSILNNYRTD